MSIFGKTVDWIEHADLQAMIGVPESLIRCDLPPRDGCTDYTSAT